MTAKGKQVGMGAGAFGGAGLFGLYAVGAITACLILALSTAVDGWLAALIVALGLLAFAGLLAALGRNQLARAVPPAPEEAIENVKADIEEVRAHAHT
jgi:membrane protein